MREIMKNLHYIFPVLLIAFFVSSCGNNDQLSGEEIDGNLLYISRNPGGSKSMYLYSFEREQSFPINDDISSIISFVDYNEKTNQITYILESFTDTGGELISLNTINVLNISSLEKITLFETEGLLWKVSWSSDGKKIVFNAKVEKDRNREIYVMNSDGSDQVNLTNHIRRESDPQWSPYGEHIVFISDRDDNQEIYKMNADGSDQVNLSNHFGSESVPQWSPDGEHIIFISDRDGNQEIYKMNSDGSNQVNLSNHIGNDSDSQWSPDGEHIIFISDRDGNQEIYKMNSDGSNLVNLSNHIGKESDPQWSPNGEHIAFVSDRDGNQEIYVLNMSTLLFTNITQSYINDEFPIWINSGLGID